MADTLNLRLRTDARPEVLLKDLLLSPLIYIRLLGILCSIVVFGCVADQVSKPTREIAGGSVTADECGYNGSNACSFAIAVGVIGFLLCLAFLVKDVLYVIVDYSDNLVVKKVILIVDAATNGLWAFMWFVAFCFATDQWRRTGGKSHFSDASANCARSGIAFSFFCILIWVAIVVVNVILFIRVFKGMDSSSRPGGPGYSSFPEGSSEQPYQGDSDSGGGGPYAPPEY